MACEVTTLSVDVREDVFVGEEESDHFCVLVAITNYNLLVKLILESRMQTSRSWSLLRICREKKWYQFSHLICSDKSLLRLLRIRISYRDQMAACRDLSNRECTLFSLIQI